MSNRLLAEVSQNSKRRKIYKNCIIIYFNFNFAPQVGNITMDQIIIDVTNIPKVKVGEIVTLLGKDGDLEITVDDWANTIGTISWEILCGFKHRLPRLNYFNNK